MKVSRLVFAACQKSLKESEFEKVALIGDRLITKDIDLLKTGCLKFIRQSPTFFILLAKNLKAKNTFFVLYD